MRLIIVLILLFAFTMPFKAQLVYRAEHDSITMTPYDIWHEVKLYSYVKLIQRAGTDYSFMINNELYLHVRLKNKLGDGSEFYDVINGHSRFFVMEDNFINITHIHLDRQRKYVLLLDEEDPAKALYMEVDTIHPDKGRFDPGYYDYY